MSTSKPSISLNRSDGQLGVDFDSAETLSQFLALLIEEDEADSVYLIPVLENNGLVPKDDSIFLALLDRLGVTDYTIPNILRGRFLQNLRQLERKLIMDLKWFEELNREEQGLFIRHLRLCYERGEFKPSKALFVRDICLPILRAFHEGFGMTGECWDLVQLAESRQFRRSEIEATIRNAYQKYQTMMTSRQAAKYLGMSQRHSRRIIASLVRLNGDIRKSKKGWLVPVVALDDWLFKHSSLVPA